MESTSTSDLPALEVLPVRMCNELVYCPRLFHLEHVQGIFVESAETVEGSAQHRRASRRKISKRKAAAEEPEAPPWADLLPRSLEFTSAAWGVRGRLDMVELAGGQAIAVEAKRGGAPEREDHEWGTHTLPYRAWPADVAQLGLYMALLRDAGLLCDEGRLFYRRNRVHTVIEWTLELELFLREVVKEAQRVRARPDTPPPLADSPKCVGCSLHGVCLPDEHHALQLARELEAAPIRRIVPGRDDRAILHVTTPGTTVRKRGDSLLVCPRDGDEQRVPIKDVAHVALFGPCQVTEQSLQHLLTRGVSISHHTSGGRMLGISSALSTRNITLRRAQFAAADAPERSLTIARALVTAKIRNQRTVVRRYRKSEPEAARDGATDDDGAGRDPWSVCTNALQRMQTALRAAEVTSDRDALRGHEGDAGASFFQALPVMLPDAWRGDFNGRTRRPPRDRVNALLSFGYALLVKDATAAIARVGLDPMLGFFHSVIPGRPALALDLMEPFRAAWVDTAVLRLLATGGIGRDDFHVTLGGVTMSTAGRRAMIAAYERRAAEMTTHPRFGYRMSYRRLLELEVRVLGKWLVGEIEVFTPLWTR